MNALESHGFDAFFSSYGSWAPQIRERLCQINWGLWINPYPLEPILNGVFLDHGLWKASQNFPPSSRSNPIISHKLLLKPPLIEGSLESSRILSSWEGGGDDAQRRVIQRCKLPPLEDRDAFIFLGRFKRHEHKQFNAVSFQLIGWFHVAFFNATRAPFFYMLSIWTLRPPPLFFGITWIRCVF